ncbi:class I SAM-dependent DNA methyltransferase [Nocardia sp. NPDC060249]|uniref:class I SAM-dependent DNA methyltransferase n=1 Tax=Nocardia sp. NPDC060249 TaxID=3347082 RepID=UPI0036661320
MVSSDVWDAAQAERYDRDSAFMYTPEVLDPTVRFLSDAADGGAALEFAIGTGRVALALIEQGIEVSGIELSAPMVDQLHRKRPGVPVVVGDMASSRVPGEFSLVYLVWNSLGNLRTQAEQVECFRNAARHLAPGGRFVVELWVPGIRRFPPGQAAVPFHVGSHHTGFDTYDLSTQQGTSHHYRHRPDGTVTYGVSHFRYVWPAECDLMAQLAGLSLERRSADWLGTPFTNDSENHVSVWRKPPDRHIG